MNATETRNHLSNVVGSLLDHLGCAVNTWAQTYNEYGPTVWMGAGDMERLVRELCEMVARFDGNTTAEEVRSIAEKIVRESAQ